jgi:hypothetical protein
MAPTEVLEQVGKMSDEEFKQHVLGIMKRELGVYGLARFLRLYKAGSGDYTRDRHQWLDGLTVDDILAETPRD